MDLPPLAGASSSDSDKSESKKSKMKQDREAKKAATVMAEEANKNAADAVTAAASSSDIPFEELFVNAIKAS